MLERGPSVVESSTGQAQSVDEANREWAEAEDGHVLSLLHAQHMRSAIGHGVAIRGLSNASGGRLGGTRYLTGHQLLRDNSSNRKMLISTRQPWPTDLKGTPSMTEQQIDSSSVRAELRTLPRGCLLLIAERAVELVPTDQLSALLGDIVHLDAVTPGTTGSGPLAPTLLDEVREFRDIAMAGQYHEEIQVNNRRAFEQSPGTDAFVADFDRLMRKCIGAVGQGENDSDVRESFEVLFGLLRHIDEGNDDVLFFADDGSSLDVGVNWRAVLPAYFRCLPETSLPKEYARTVDDAIADFASHDRPHYLTMAGNTAKDAQRAALDALVVTEK